MKRKTKIAALLLAVLMLVGVIPFAAFAEEATALDSSVLDKLASQATGNPYEMISTDTLVANIVTAGNGKIFTEGGYQQSGNLGVYREDYAPAILDGGTANGNGNENFKWINGEGQFVDKTSSSSYSNTYEYVKANKNIDTSFGDSRYVVFSMNMKRGEAMNADMQFARLRIKASQQAAAIAEFNFIKYNAVSGTLTTPSGTTAVPFSTSVFSNITLVYDRTANSYTTYVNGVSLGTETLAVHYPSHNQFVHDVTWNFNTLNFTGRYFSLDRVRLFSANTSEAVNSCIASVSEAANGVFKLGDNYYLFENNAPVIGKTVSYNGYSITTEKNTGIITDCHEINAEEEAINAALAAGKVYITGHSATLENNIAINFYAKVPTDKVKWATVYLDGEKQGESMNVRNMTPEADGNYKFTVSVPSNLLCAEVGIGFDSGSGLANSAVAIAASSIPAEESCYKYVTTTKDYLNKLIADDSQTAPVKKVANALLVYGAASEAYFSGGENSEDVINAVAGVDTATSWGALKVASGESENLGTIQLILGGTTAIRINLSGEIDATKNDFHSNPNISYNETEGYVQISNLKAHQLGTTVDLTIDGAALKVSVLGAAQLVANDTTGAYTDNFKTLAKALKVYSDAANAYKASL